MKRKFIADAVLLETNFAETHLLVWISVMGLYFAIAATFVALGIYTFALCHWWVRYLKNLAANYDIPERRRRAARNYLIFLLFIVVPLFGTVFEGVATIPKHVGFVLFGLICSIAPTIIWWVRRMPSLYALGYGRQSERRGGN